MNSTGIFRPTPFLEQTEEQVEEALDSILRPTSYVAQAAAREMVRRGGGAIVNVGSMWALDAITATPTSAYSAAQAGRHALTKNLAVELAPHGIRVNTVALAFRRDAGVRPVHDARAGWNPFTESSTSRAALRPARTPPSIGIVVPVIHPARSHEPRTEHPGHAATACAAGAGGALA